MVGVCVGVQKVDTLVCKKRQQPNKQSDTSQHRNGTDWRLRMVMGVVRSSVRSVECAVKHQNQQKATHSPPGKSGLPANVGNWRNWEKNWERARRETRLGRPWRRVGRGQTAGKTREQRKQGGPGNSQRARGPTRRCWGNRLCWEGEDERKRRRTDTRKFQERWLMLEREEKGRQRPRKRVGRPPK